jgi:hypothetical protein
MPGVRGFCDEFLEIEACDPAPGAHLAFSIEAMRLSTLHICLDTAKRSATQALRKVPDGRFEAQIAF